MANCVFCEIIEGKREADIIYENEYVAAFYGLTKTADVHVLVIPKKHIESIMGFTEEDEKTIFEIHKAIQWIAKEFQVNETGFRVLTNTGLHGQQEIKHVHYHVIGGRQLKWDM